METTKGIKSTEFWVTLGTSIFSILNQSGVIGIPLPIDLLQWIIGGASAYVISRCGVKAVAINSNAKIVTAQIGSETK